jgi:hypothetical protein
MRRVAVEVVSLGYQSGKVVVLMLCVEGPVADDSFILLEKRSRAKLSRRDFDHP